MVIVSVFVIVCMPKQGVHDNAPDLTVKNIRIYWDPWTMIAEATIANVGNKDAKDIFIAFEGLRDPALPKENLIIDQEIKRLPKREYVTVEASFSPLANQDNQRLWDVEKIRVIVDPGNKINEKKEKNNVREKWLPHFSKYYVTRVCSLRNRSSDRTIKGKISVLDFTDYKNTRILGTWHSKEPVDTVYLENGMRRLVFEFELDKRQRRNMALSWSVLVRDFNEFSYHKLFGLNQMVTDTRYLDADRFIESDHSKIKSKSKTLTSSEPNIISKIEAIARFVQDSVRFEVMNTKGALWALENRRGDCTERTTLAVALARSVGIPARVMGMEQMNGIEGTSKWANHNYAEFFIKDMGWVPYNVHNRGADFGELKKNQMMFRRGTFTDKNIEWYTFSDLSGPKDKLEVSQRHVWKILSE